MNELTLAIKQNPGTIEMNFDALEEQLDKKLDEYRGAVFTEDTKTIAKAEIASLRRLKKDIEDGRKTVKNHYLVNVPAVANPEFEQAVREMEESVQPEPEEIIQAVHDTQEEPEDCPPPRTGTGKERTGRRNGRFGR